MAAPTAQEFDGGQHLTARSVAPKSPSMSVETVRFDRLSANIKVVGELDMATAAPLCAVLQGHVASGRRFLRLDLSHLTFLDATALRGITGVHKDLLARRGTLVITGVRPRVARVFRLAGLDEVLLVSGSRGDDDLPAAAELDPARVHELEFSAD